MNLTPKVTLVFDRRKLATATKPGEVAVEIYYRSRRKRYSAHVSVLPRQWGGGVIIKHPDMYALNAHLMQEKKRYEDMIAGIIKEDGEFSFETFDELLGSKSSKQKSPVHQSFIDYISDRIENRRDIAESTKKSQRKIIGALTEFGLIQKIGDLTKGNILLFDEFLRKRDYRQPTIHSYHKVLKTYVHDAILHDLLKEDPYLGLKIPKGKSQTRRYLTEEEIRKIMDCDNLPDCLHKVRDLFIFQCYTGLAYADLMSFDFSKVIERDGKYVIQDKRQKTEEDYYLVLLSPAVRILKKYNFVLPRMTNQQYNLRLKVVGENAGIGQSLTSHMARHSFAVLCLNKKIPMESVSKMLGHSNTNTTHLYAKLLNSTLERDFDLLESRL